MDITSRNNVPLSTVDSSRGMDVNGNSADLSENPNEDLACIDTATVEKRDTLALLVKHTESNQPVDVVLTVDKLQVYQTNSSTATARRQVKLLHDIPLQYLFAVRMDPDNNDSLKLTSKSNTVVRSRFFTVFYLGSKSGKEESIDRYESLSFECHDRSQCGDWVKLLRSRCISWKRRRARVLILINPVSGQRNAKQIFNDQVLPLFEVALNSMPNTFAKFEVMETTHAGHAKQIVNEFSWRKYNTIAVCGGDGLVHEVVNGLLDRGDWEWMRRKVCLAIIPTGTSNALSQTLLQCMNPMFCAAMIVKGFCQPVDTVSLFQNGQRQYALATALCGLFADVENWSNRWRRLGNHRYIIGGLKSVLHMHYFKGKLEFVPVQSMCADDLLWKEQNERHPQTRWKRTLSNSGSDVCSTASSSPSTSSSSSSDGSSTSTSTSSSIPNISSIFGNIDDIRRDNLQSGPQCILLERYFPGYATGEDSLNGNEDDTKAVTSVDDRFLSITMANVNHLDKDWALDRDLDCASVLNNGLVNLSFIRQRLRRDQLFFAGVKSRLRREWQRKDMRVETVMSKVFKITPCGGDDQQKNSAFNFSVDGEPIAIDKPLYGEIHESLLLFVTVPT